MQSAKKSFKLSYRQLTETETVMASCTGCGECKHECSFLQKYGLPKDIAAMVNEGDQRLQGSAFECSLCGLCGAVCPERIDPARMFLELRRNSVLQGNGEWPEHKGLLAFEQTGVSGRYTWYGLPDKCDTVFFPGCALSGTRPETTFKLYSHLKQHIPALGVVLDCCTKPSHDLGREDVFSVMFGEMKEYLAVNGIQTVLVACPNCFKVFQEYGGPIKVKTVYEAINETGMQKSDFRFDGEAVTIHDPCVLRYESEAQNSIRELIERQGIQIEEMNHSKEKTLCCGEGGSVACISPDLAGAWIDKRKEEAGDKRVITWCAGCANFLGRSMSVVHIADLVVNPESTLAGKAAVSKAPFTYLNRLKLKKRFKSEVPVVTFRERPVVPGGISKKKGIAVKLLLMAVLTAAFIYVRNSGALSFFEQENLKHWIEGYGLLAPLVYMLIYTLAPVLFIPALPITLAGGVLFGPVWGVVYAITGATSGACLSFLISRYFAGNWVRAKLAGPRWGRLDSEVEKHGWKVVAFTRLIPVFPYNLLNYAFGLTRIRFPEYAVTTFVCMLPACIAFIVFSSSLSELVMGRVSIEFIAGVVLIIMVSLIPAIWRRFSSGKGSG